MASRKGWVKIYRDIIDHWVYRDPLTLKIWITLIVRANHEPTKIQIKNQLIDVQRGQFWTSLRRLAMVTDMTPKTVKKRLTVLQSDGMIYVDSSKGLGTLITVRNYGDYQSISEDNGNTVDYTVDYTTDHRVETQRDTRRTHKQEVKNDKNDTRMKRKNNGLPPDHPDYFEEV